MQLQAADPSVLLPDSTGLESGKTIQKLVPDLFPYLAAGRSFLCYSPQKGPEETIRTLFNKPGIKKLIDFDFTVHGDKDEIYNLVFENKKPKRIKLTKNKNEPSKITIKDQIIVVKYVIQADDQGSDDEPESKILFRAYFNEKCDLIAFEKWNFGDGFGNNDTPSEKILYNSEGKIIIQFLVDDRVKSLEEIYPNTHRKLQENHVIIGVIDSGVAFNDPALADTIDRPGEEKRKKLELKFLELKNQWISKKAEQKGRNFFGNLWYGNEDQNKINTSENELEECRKELQQVSIGWDFMEDDPWPYDNMSFSAPVFAEPFHGTHVAGIIVKNTDELSLLPIRVPIFVHLPETTTPVDFIKVVDYAYTRGVRIINLSIIPRSATEEFSLRTAVEKYSDILFVVGAGNGNRERSGINLDQETSVFPGSFHYPNFVAVASVDEKGELSRFSNYGENAVAFAAPGENIESHIPGGSLVRWSGTSMATPFVTRVAARVSMRMKTLNLKPQTIIQEILKILSKSIIPNPSLSKKIKFPGVLSEELALRKIDPSLGQAIAVDLPK